MLSHESVIESLDSQAKELVDQSTKQQAAQEQAAQEQAAQEQAAQEPAIATQYEQLVDLANVSTSNYVPISTIYNIIVYYKIRH